MLQQFSHILPVRAAAQRGRDHPPLRRQLSAGQSVVAGSGNFRRSERDTVRTTAGELSLEIVTIHVDTPEALARQRLIAKRNTKSRLDVTEDEFAHILRVWEPPTADEHPLTFHAGEDMENWISRHRAFLAPE